MKNKDIFGTYFTINKDTELVNELSSEDQKDIKDFVSILDQCECNDNHNYPIPQAVPLSRKNLCDQCFGEKHIMIFKNGRWTCENKSF